jgi:hypothetical protein
MKCFVPAIIHSKIWGYIFGQKKLLNWLRAGAVKLQRSLKRKTTKRIPEIGN